jgi:hypothetical protein
MSALDRIEAIASVDGFEKSKPARELSPELYRL